MLGCLEGFLGNSPLYGGRGVHPSCTGVSAALLPWCAFHTAQFTEHLLGARALF